MHASKGNQNVTSVILNVLSLGESVDIFDSFVHRPKTSHLENELQNLRQYHMIGENNQLTLLGRRVNDMSADPLVAKMMLWGSIFGCGEEAAIVSAGLSNSRLFPMPAGHKESKKKRKKNRSHKPPSRSDLIGMLTLSPTSDALSILGAIQNYNSSNDKNEFCVRYLLDQTSVEEVLGLKKTIVTEMAKLKGAERRKMSLECLENILASAYLPNLTWTK